MLVEHYQELLQSRVGWVVRHLREVAELSQAELAEAMTRAGTRMDQTGLHRREQGVRPWRLDELAAVARVLNTSVTEIVGEAEK